MKLLLISLVVLLVVVQGQPPIPSSYPGKGEIRLLISFYCYSYSNSCGKKDLVHRDPFLTSDLLWALIPANYNAIHYDYRTPNG